ncbi:MAG: prolyl oligopeptidase family serine peptidase [Dokdonella sp.]|mgnify:FL=1|jgi:dipeptidyl aminopeptidase/acylaminoacyl peptidase|uniref:alpha/beta hydrolase family protein n=1 Tax=Dokdonella sp. TaxID=2291710 RepID=UPI001B6D88FD|nr:prolyl oligopeptidase family serine peptidase [Dokdonella sp.]MBP6326226.1 prolyl oligopeptidase family serine peptidase [Dokdonella sp.]MBP6330244.1 prolyl oligopeptidase family serine peptidase [Dokdonella sp.]HNV08116.1 prolyl oligopeptidase family serine peptidase [Dokdonella sp.]HPW03157.1 prolyl oligopeptidase family serine peptidase [Dokdonella sp.]HQV49742.1 prolyl oligopeptidase family serine peptidase [Dokdonella sp.]
MCRITRVDRIVTPLFIYAGANDPRVPHAQSDQLAARLREHGVPVEYMLPENEGHGASAPATQRELAVRSMRFVLRVLTSSATER